MGTNFMTATGSCKAKARPLLLQCRTKRGKQNYKFQAHPPKDNNCTRIIDYDIVEFSEMETLFIFKLCHYSVSYRTKVNLI